MAQWWIICRKSVPKQSTLPAGTMTALRSLRKTTVQVLIFLLVVFLLRDVGGSSCAERNPYDVLRVSRDAPQEQIRQKYRELCLRYHPDKNVNKSTRERRRCEDLFKQIQQAYSQIGDKDSRHKYDTMCSSSFPAGFGSGLGGVRGDSSDPFFRAFTTGPQSFFFFSSGRGPPPFQGFDVFPRGLFTSPQTPYSNNAALKSIYVQKIKVPLKDLYEGIRGVQVSLVDNPWNRYLAAFRGGIAFLALYQGSLYSLPLLRIGKFVTLLFGLVNFHMHIPRPRTISYEVDIKPGYKSGTRFVFKDAEPGFDVVFVIEEEKHHRYTRIGNDLHMTIQVSPTEARRGCKIAIAPLNDADPPITICLQPNEIQRSGQKIVLKSKGWPIRGKNGNIDHGNLIVHIVWESSQASHRRRKAFMNK